ncbi:MAG: helix-turn-helix domain-containing protein, partial [Acidobacteriota bacterium]
MFKIGDFSKIAQVPASQLRYYADIGLFEPAQVDPFTGYRFYGAGQLTRLNRILVLKDLGLTLDQIRQALSDDISAEEVRGMLRMRKATIEQSLEEEAQRLRAVEARLLQIESGGEDIEVVLKPIRKQHFLSLRETYPSMTDTGEIFREILQILPERFGPRLGYMTAIMHGVQFDTQNIDIELGFAIQSDSVDQVRLPSQRVLSTRELPAVETMATVARVGSTANSCRSYGALG